MFAVINDSLICAYLGSNIVSVPEELTFGSLIKEVSG
jgi:hypothetical protein